MDALRLLRKVISYIFPVNDKIIVFQSIPDYADNAKALSDYLEKNTKYCIVWLIDNEKFDIPDSRARFVIASHRKRLFYLLNKNYYLCVAKYIFSTHRFHLPYSQKRSEQNFILLWHGCGYKGNSSNNTEKFFDFACVPGNLFIATKCKFWNTTPESIISMGYPRYDWLLNPQDPARLLYESIRQGNDKVIIWMPTFRNSVHKGLYKEDSITKFPLIEAIDDWETINYTCQNNKVKLIVKTHMSQKDYGFTSLKFSNISFVTNDFFNEANVQMYEFIGLCDALISDYSSIAVDYLLVNKPLAFVLTDYEEYRNARGFVFDNPKDYMPGHHLYSLSDFESFMEDVSNGTDVYKDARKQFSDVAIYKSHNYCEVLSRHLRLV